jgi:LAO/AO transport system kinase
MSDETEKTPEPSAMHVMPGVSVDKDRVGRIRKRKSLAAEEYVKGVMDGDRVALGRAFSLMESINEGHREKANQVLSQLLPQSGNAIRLGISGVPGVGKSTFIEAFGMHLIEEGHRVAVLAIDPSSEVTGGSILGDKTRMEKLSSHPNALVRPSACGGWLGGVARSTREAIIVCEAAGFDVVIVETVGVGQSETSVASMVDFFLLLTLAGAGDELQGIKRGIMEVADGIAINKSDGDNIPHAKAARIQLQSALRLMRSPAEPWQPKVTLCSSLTGDGINEIWKIISQHRQWGVQSGHLAERRRQQALYWMEQTVEALLRERFDRHPAIQREGEAIRSRVLEGNLSPFIAAENLISLAFPQKSEDEEGDPAPQG